MSNFPDAAACRKMTWPSSPTTDKPGGERTDSGSGGHCERSAGPSCAPRPRSREREEVIDLPAATTAAAPSVQLGTRCPLASARSTWCSTHHPAIARQASAQLRHAFAHAWQCSALCFPHSAPQASQTSAQTLQRAVAKREPLAMNAAASQQIRVQSRSSRMHSAIIFTSASPRHALAQCSQACAQRTHSSIQDWCFPECIASSRLLGARLHWSHQ
jgi:hypothetical protein